MRPPPTSLVAPTSNSAAALRFLRGTLLLLVLELTFEGLARKLNFKGMNVAIFLLKDVIVAALAFQIIRLRRPAELKPLWLAYMAVIGLFLPVVIQTGSHDIVLAIFGAKEYLLYPVVAFAVYTAFEKSTMTEIIGFFRWLALLVIPTAMTALLQLHLPADHWLNRSVDGSDLEGFSAGGHLRVSSTFPFVAQYCAFIDAEVFIVMIALNTLKDLGFFRKLVFLSIIPLLIMSSYVTGSRGAVLICCLVVMIGAGLALIKFRSRSAFRVVAMIVGLLVMLGVTRFVYPDAFAAYAEREQGQLLGASTEIQTRIYGSMFDWMNNVGDTPFFGYGLGIMSNGSDLLSRYAQVVRANSWTETDMATTLFEGGLYLIVVWYAFRYYVVLLALQKFFQMKNESLSLPGAFCVGFVAVMGISGTLAIQPPIAIWWWLSVGSLLVVWKKSIEPKEGAPPTEQTPPTQRAKLRGRSTYAERLHAEQT